MAAPMRKLSLMENIYDSSISHLRSLSYSSECFDELSEVSYDEFFKKYLLPNKPCVFSSGLTQRWKSRNDWVTEDGCPSFQYMREIFGEAVVPVANCNEECYQSHKKCEMKMCEYLDYWEKYRACSYPEKEPCLYLKDWHFQKAYPEYGAYTTPVYFKSDWLNEFWDTLPRDDYRFVYMGPKGTWTPFHSDVYRSHSWSANICGKKKWIFYPPGCEESLKDSLGNLVYDITCSDMENPQKFPHAAEVKGRRIEVIQTQGQVMFVPSGWHHQVINLEDTISINHNWLNASNIDLCWKHLQSSLTAVQLEIADCRDMEGWAQQCQVILNASAGIDYKTFIKMLHTIATNRIHALQSKGVKLGSSKSNQRDEKGVCSDCWETTKFNIGTDENSSTSAHLLTDTKSVSCDVSLSEIHKTCRQSISDLKRNYYLKCNISGIGHVSKSVANGDVKSIEEILPQILIDPTDTVSGSENIKSENIKYLLFDIVRIKETLEHIVQDDDYKEMDLNYSESAEAVLNIICKYLFM